LASVTIVPATARVPVLGQKAFRACACDASGREILDGVEFAWQCAAPVATLAADGKRAVLHVGEPAALGERIVLTVLATAGAFQATADATVTVVLEIDEPTAHSGVPQPEFVNEPAGNWRSRFRDGQWEVNAGHRDYQIANESTRRKLRYLAALLAKEIILHSFPHPQHAAVLERMVEVLTLTERRLER
jgi:hypothetical protein